MGSSSTSVNMIRVVSYMPPGIVDAMDREALRKQISRSDLVRRWCDEKLDLIARPTKA